MIHLCQGALEEAKKSFEEAAKATHNGRPNIAGLMALAGLLFRQEKYSEALAL